MRLNKQFIQLDDSVLDSLVVKLREGQATEKDKEDIFNSIVKLIIKIVKRFVSKVPQKCREDIYSEAFEALVLAINEAQQKLYNNDIQKFCSYRVLSRLRNFVREETKRSASKFQQYNDDVSEIDTGQELSDLREELTKIIENDREKLIIDYLYKGYNRKEIADRLKISPTRVKQLCQYIGEKILERGNLNGESYSA